MTVEDVREKLLKESTLEQERGWSPLDTNGEETYGLNFGKIKEIARQFPKDPTLADELYASKNHDLKVLATYIDDPESYTRDELQKRIEQLYPSPFAEKFCQNVVAKSNYAVHFIDSLASCGKGDYLCYAYHTLAEVAKQKNKLSDEFYANYLRAIARTVSEAPDIVRDAMAASLKSIGNRDEKLKKMCDEIAAKFNDVIILSPAGIKAGKKDVMYSHSN